MILLPQLLSYYTRTFPSLRNPSITRLDLIPTGWESEVYAFDLEHGSEEARRREALILRVYPGDHAHEKASKEFSGMSLLLKAGYPVPHLYHLETDETHLGNPFVIMERIEGPVLWDQMILPDGGIEPHWLDFFCELFVRLHRLEWKPYVDDPTLLDARDPYNYFDQTLSNYREWDKRSPELGFAPVLDWLSAHRDGATCSLASVVHMDFHPQNILIRLGEPKTAAVIDWTNLAIYDPRFDLAWTLILSYAYLGEDARSAILRGYEKASGAPVEHIEVFEVFACCRRLADIVMSISLGAEKLGMRPRAEELMKQQIAPALRVSERLHKITGLKIQRVEEILR